MLLLCCWTVLCPPKAHPSSRRRHREGKLSLLRRAVSLSPSQSHLTEASKKANTINELLLVEVDEFGGYRAFLDVGQLSKSALSSIESKNEETLRNKNEIFFCFENSFVVEPVPEERYLRPGRGGLRVRRF